MKQALELAVVFFAALATGGLIVNWIGLGRAMSRLSASAYIELHQTTNRTFDPYMPIVVVGALLGGVCLAVVYGIHSLPGQLATAGAVCYAAVMIVGLSTCVRINKQIARWSVQNPPDEWAQARARWLHFHVIRTIFSVPALAIYVLAILLHYVKLHMSLA